MRILSLAGRKISTALTDIRYGAILKGDGGTRFKHLGVTGTVSSGYDVLPSLFAGQVRPDDVLVDVGCGKGRVLNWWLEHYPRHKIYGIEIDPELAHEARQRLHKFPNVTILTGDACRRDVRASGRIPRPSTSTHPLICLGHREDHLRDDCDRAIELHVATCRSVC
ncbi:MAG: class I SAM-dependent methyltransferase [Xanthobacteraceae bacterium]